MLALLALVIVSSTPCPPGEMLEGGTHRRLETSRGAVHLWCRGEFDSVVFYVHGYRDTVDSAFTGHALAAQFSRSQRPALFVAVAAPSGPNEKVVFDDLDALVNELPVSVPEKTTLIGHSGGNRTLKAWLRSSRATDVVLLDGFYGDASAWTRWLTARPDASLRMVGQHTWERAERWRTQLPKPLRERVSHRPSHATHMEIVTAGKWIPRMLGAQDDS
ncbi:MAG: hypothetical protein ACO1OB_20340 [Archangium sp.]